jgi:hypothetical protein
VQRVRDICDNAQTVAKATIGKTHPVSIVPVQDHTPPSLSGPSSPAHLSAYSYTALHCTYCCRVIPDGSYMSFLAMIITRCQTSRHPALAHPRLTAIRFTCELATPQHLTTIWHGAGAFATHCPVSLRRYEAKLCSSAGRCGTGSFLLAEQARRKRTKSVDNEQSRGVST